MEVIQDLPTADYEITWFQAGDFQDPHGNYWCNAAFQGVSEPVRWVVKDPTKVTVGDKVYGKFTLEKSKTGNTYIRFRKEQKPEPEQAPAQTATKKEWKSDEEFYGDKSSQIKAQWAIGQAVQMMTAVPAPGVVSPKDYLEEKSKMLYAMVDRIVGLKAGAAPVQERLSVEEQQAQEQAKRDAQRLKDTFSDGSPIPDEVHFPEEEPIDLNDIPF